MCKAAETIVFFLIGGERDDHNCPFISSRMCFTWVGWEAATWKLIKAR